MMSTPCVSVLVTIVDGGDALRQCLVALGSQQSAPSMEVIVPYDDSVPQIGELAADFSSVQFVPMGAIRTERPIATPAGQHELYDRRRSVGLSVAIGDIICILEDRGIPEPGWACTVARLHAQLPYAVIGGAVECGVDAPLNWAVYFCDYARYQPPFLEGPRHYVTDVNISYKREVIERNEELWRHRYHETTLHWQLERDGETLYLTPDLLVRQHRRSLRLGSILRERVEWGRLFAYTRVREGGWGKRLVYAGLSPLLPLVLLLRHTRTQVTKRTRLKQFLRASPMVALFLVTWSLGEMVGYVTGRP